MFSKPGHWFAFNDAIYGRRPGKFCYEIEGRLNVLAVDSVKYKIEWAYQHTLTYLLPPDYYLYAFRILLLDSNGDLLPIT
ncbi:hypothetical protein [Caudoviricetes sp.]|nr:hypothetical protein [Caudoviricetes sp.]